MACREKVGELIRDNRLSRGWTQEELAEKLHLSASAIGMYESGRRYPKPNTLVALADLFNCSVGYLTGTEDEINAQRSLASLRAEFEAYENMQLDNFLSKSAYPSNVHPISDLHHQRVPLIGSAAAGEPIYDPEDLGVYVASPVECDAAITVKGDSMEPTYKDGDLVYIKCVLDVPEGAVAVVFLDDEATIKHVYKRPTGLTLWSDNPSYTPMQIEFANYNSVRIFGVPVGFTRIYKSKAIVKKGF